MNLIDTFIEIEPVNNDEFLKVKETLTRIGIPSRKGTKPVLWQSCHILHKKGRYYIVHFKQLFLLDGKVNQTNFKLEDQERTKFIAKLLAEWGLVQLITPIGNVEDSKVAIIPYATKEDWQLSVKYNIGNKL